MLANKIEAKPYDQPRIVLHEEEMHFGCATFITSHELKALLLHIGPQAEDVEESYAKPAAHPSAWAAKTEAAVH